MTIADSRVVGWQWRNARGHWEQCTATGSVNYRDAGFKVRPTVPLSLLAEAERLIAVASDKMHERDKELIRLTEKNDTLQSRLDAVVGLARNVLDRDGDTACGCIHLSRSAEREYEMGNCPHQRLRAALGGESPGNDEELK